MATPNDGERQGLSRSLRSQTGYGTATLSAATKKTAPRTRKFISRKVQKSDTLMGIALKYGVTVQDLKRENKLWSTDHLFLVEKLLIPLTAENENSLDGCDSVVVYNGTSFSSSSPSSSSSSHLPNGDVNNFQTNTTAADVHNGSKFSSSVSSSSHRINGPKSRSPTDGDIDRSDSEAASSTTKTRSKSTPNDFFSKYDNNIARLKGDVAKMEKNAAAELSVTSEVKSCPSTSSASATANRSLTVNEDLELTESETHLDGIIDANPLSLPPRRGSGSSRRDSNSSTSSVERRGRLASEPEDSTSPVLVIRTRTHQRHVKSTIENLQQVNDDMFEL